jgi:hypothetical protein
MPVSMMATFTAAPWLEGQAAGAFTRATPQGASAPEEEEAPARPVRAGRASAGSTDSTEGKTVPWKEGALPSQSSRQTSGPAASTSERPDRRESDAAAMPEGAFTRYAFRAGISSSGARPCAASTERSTAASTPGLNSTMSRSSTPAFVLCCAEAASGHRASSAAAIVLSMGILRPDPAHDGGPGGTGTLAYFWTKRPISYMGLSVPAGPAPAVYSAATTRVRAMRSCQVRAWGSFQAQR